MRRAGKTTIPYTFCLFCAVSGLVLVMAALAGVLAWRDTRQSMPDRAEVALRAAIVPGLSAMEAHFDPLLAQLHRTERWVASGVYPESAMGQWPATLLPLLSERDDIQTATFVKANGAFWRWERDGDAWRGFHRDGTSRGGPIAASRWSASGKLLPGKPLLAMSEDPREAAWLPRALAPSGEWGGVSVHLDGLEASESRSTAVLAIAVCFPSGRSGALALEVDPAALQHELAGLAVAPARVIFDFGGRMVHQLQDPAALELLQERALPSSFNPALDALVAPETVGRVASWYKAGVYTPAAGESWWVLAAVAEADLPAPALPVGRYLVWSLACGMAGALALSVLLGRRITRPLRQVAARARNIQALDEHYVPWPSSRFTEVNTLTSALETIYESAVEHLDYHDAPLVVWAQPDTDPEDDTIVVDAVRHVMNIPRGNGKDAPAAPDEPAINVSGVPDVVAGRASTPAAAQLQVIHGTRREVRRLQGQLAGANEELRTTSARFEEGQLRMRRQRACLRELHKRLQVEGAVSMALLDQLREALDVSRVSLWIAGEQRTRFRLRMATGVLAGIPDPLQASLRLRALLEEESAVAVADPRNDTRLETLAAHAVLRDGNPSLLLAPVKLSGQLLGFILAEHTGQPRRWKSDEELFLTSVAAQCAGALWRQLRQEARAIAGAHVAGARPGAGHRNGNGHGHVSGHRNGNGNGTAHAVQDAAADGEAVVLVWETDLAGCIKRIQGDVALVYGRALEQLVGQPITFLSDAAQGRADLERLSLLLAGMPCIGYETCHRGVGGAPVYLRVDAELLRDANDRIAGARGTARLLHVAAGV